MLIDGRKPFQKGLFGKNVGLQLLASGGQRGYKEISLHNSLVCMTNFDLKLSTDQHERGCKLKKKNKKTNKRKKQKQLLLSFLINN